MPKRFDHRKTSKADKKAKKRSETAALTRAEKAAKRAVGEKYKESGYACTINTFRLFKSPTCAVKWSDEWFAEVCALRGAPPKIRGKQNQRAWLADFARLWKAFESARSAVRRPPKPKGHCQAGSAPERVRDQATRRIGEPTRLATPEEVALITSRLPLADELIYSRGGKRGGSRQIHVAFCQDEDTIARVLGSVQQAGPDGEVYLLFLHGTSSEAARAITGNGFRVDFMSSEESMRHGGGIYGTNDVATAIRYSMLYNRTDQSWSEGRTGSYLLCYVKLDSKKQICSEFSVPGGGPYRDDQDLLSSEPMAWQLKAAGAGLREHCLKKGKLVTVDTSKPPIHAAPCGSNLVVRDPAAVQVLGCVQTAVPMTVQKLRRTQQSLPKLSFLDVAKAAFEDRALEPASKTVADLYTTPRREREAARQADAVARRDAATSETKRRRKPVRLEATETLRKHSTKRAR